MKIKYIAFIFILFAGLLSCEKEEVQISGPAERTVLIYMAADNSLSSFGKKNITKMLEGAGDKNLNRGNLLVYFDPVDSIPQLLQIVTDKNGIAQKKVIHTYPEHNSASVEVMNEVITSVTRDFPAESYGLVLWSHATAWLPYNVGGMLRSFGEDRGSVMELSELAAAVPDDIFDFILFDACYMANIEVAYAMRHKANYIIASPTETLAEGFPYDQIIAPMFSQKAALETICSRFYNYYNSQSSYATVSLISTAHLDELAAMTKEIVQGKTEDIYTLPIKEMQQLEYLTYNRHALYDYDDFISRLATPEQYTAFQKQMDETVLYKNHTPRAIFGNGSTLPINHYSGLSVYVPQKYLATLNTWYKQHIEWYKAVYAESAEL